MTIKANTKLKKNQEEVQATARHFDVHELVNTRAKTFKYAYITAYTQSGAGIHKKVCSVERVTIPLEQDQHNIVNTLDAHDLADTTIQHYASRDNHEFFWKFLDARNATLPAARHHYIHW